MSAEVTYELECSRKFLEHRAALPPGALTPYAGRWIAWSPDGSRIVADSQAPEDLDERIRAAGEDPERCVVEGVPSTNAMLGGDGLGAAGSSGFPTSPCRPVSPSTHLEARRSVIDPW